MSAACFVRLWCRTRYHRWETGECEHSAMRHRRIHAYLSPRNARCHVHADVRGADDRIVNTLAKPTGPRLMSGSGLSAAEKARRYPGYVLLEELLEEPTDMAKAALRAWLVVNNSSTHDELGRELNIASPGRPGYREALTTFLEAAKLSGKELLGDLVLAGWGKQIVVHSYREAIREYLCPGYDHVVAPGDLTYLWERFDRAKPSAPKGKYRTMHQHMMSTRVPAHVAWFDEWFSLTAQLRWNVEREQRQHQREFYRDGWVTWLAQGDETRRVVAEGLFDGWVGRLEDLEATVTNLVLSTS